MSVPDVSSVPGGNDGHIEPRDPLPAGHTDSPVSYQRASGGVDLTTLRAAAVAGTFGGAVLGTVAGLMKNDVFVDVVEAQLTRVEKAKTKDEQTQELASLRSTLRELGQPVNASDALFGTGVGAGIGLCLALFMAGTWKAVRRILYG